ncbi:MAG TPA: choice-of-anchor tandem repeat GloVer-containing protein, partial [Terriglobales bacterium]|nr:choice-of-anchor tandem repeat GloVer-containing protein [Terriglobales bacterium]
MKFRSIPQARLLLTFSCVLMLLVSMNTKSLAQTFSVVYNFGGGADGGYPLAGLVIDTEGNLYGTASVGGNFACSASGCGTVFKIDTSGTYSVLYSFAGGNDGANPEARLYRDS